jgi:hypothetical protein
MFGSKINIILQLGIILNNEASMFENFLWSFSMVDRVFLK